MLGFIYRITSFFFHLCSIPTYDDDDLMINISGTSLREVYEEEPMRFERGSVMDMVKIINCRFYGTERPLIVRGVLVSHGIDTIVIDGYCIHKNGIDDAKAKALASLLVCHGIKYSALSRPWEQENESYELYTCRMQDKKMKFVYGYHDVDVLTDQL